MTDLALSAVDFLGLAEERHVIKIDLSEVGREGILFARELSSGEKEAIMRPPKGRTTVHKGGSVELDLSQMPTGAAAKLMKACLVTDETGATLMYDLWLKQLSKPHLVMERLNEIPNAVTNLIVGKIREVSGLDDDEGQGAVAKKK